MNRLTDEEKVKMVTLFQEGKSSNEIGKILNRKTEAINKMLRFRKLIPPAKKYSLNHDIFSKINTEEKAYYLGLLYADGCIHKNGLIISLSEPDLQTLLHFQQFLGSNHKINRRIDKRQPNSPPMYTLHVTSNRLTSDLKRLGCLERKSLILQFPKRSQVPTSLWKHFIRGYFDGDGSITRYLNKKDRYYKYCGTIVSTFNFCNKLTKIFKNKCDINTYLHIRYKERQTTTRQLKISGRKQIFRLMEWLYKDAKIYMQRKYNSFQEMKTEYELRQVNKLNLKVKTNDH